MTLRSFEELAQQNSPLNLFVDTTAKPLRDQTSGYATPSSIADAQEMQSRSVFAAAFRQDNTVASFMSREDMGVDNHDDGTFDPYAYAKEHPSVNDYTDSFVGVLNRPRAEGIRAQIEMEQRDRETLAASGWNGTLAQLAAGVFDLPTLIPGSVALRGAKGGFSIAKSMLMAGATAGATQAGVEGFLQGTQQIRTAEESLVNIGSAVVLGSLIGGGVAAVLGKNERITMERALDEIADINSGAQPNPLVVDNPLQVYGGSNTGAAVVEGAFYVNPIDAAKTRSAMAVEGAAAGALVKATSFLNPVLRGTQRYAASARQITNTLYESTIYRAMHSANETTGASVETAMRTRVEGLQAQALVQAGTAYKDAIKAGVRVNNTEFYKQVGRAMRNKDVGENDFVSRAAQAYRKMFDEFTKDALDLDLLDADDLDVSTAASYFSRMYNRDQLTAQEPEFMDLIGRHYAERMQEAYKTETLTYQLKVAKHQQRRDDLAQVGAARSARIDEIRASGNKLDGDNEQLVEMASAVTEARGAALTAKGSANIEARKTVKHLLDKGGPELKAYMEKRGELRRRFTDLTSRNPDAQLAKGEKLSARLDDIEDTVARSLLAFSKQAKNALNKLASKPVNRAEDAIAAFEPLVRRAEQAVVKAQDQAARAVEKGADGGIVQATLDNAEARFAAVIEKLAARDAGVGAARELVEQLDGLIDDITRSTAQRSIRRGEYAQRIKDRAAALSPDEVAARAAQQNQRLDAVELRADEQFYAKWGKRLALGQEKNEAFDFEAAGRDAAREIYGKITGKTQHREDIPSFITKITSGPLKDRTFMVPDELLAGRGWLNDDVRQVANRYSRAMGGEIELTRRFGRADMADQLSAVAREYSDLRVAADKAENIEQLNTVIGSGKFTSRSKLVDAKREAQMALAADEKSAIEDMQAGRDLIRGTYRAAENNTNFASVTRSLMGFNYLRQMGGVLLSNVAEFYRPAMVHGLKSYMSAMPKLIPQAFNAGSNGVKMSLDEAKLAGLVIQRTTHALQNSNAEVGDPFLSNVSYIERWMQKGTGLASRWNMVNLFTDAQQAIASTLSQHRILESVVGNGGKDGSFSDNGTRLLRMLGIDAGTQDDIARLFAVHGQNVDGIQVANTEKWLQAANAAGNGDDIIRAERAVRAYRNAVNMDVNSIVSRKGLGDSPLFANHPVGKVIMQFSGYTVGAHSRVTVRALQEDKTRLVGGLVAVSSLGALTSYFAAWRGGEERWNKFNADVEANGVGVLIGEGLDRSGMFPLLFDLSNRAERVSSGVGYNYRFNPIKSTIRKATGGNALGVVSTRGSDSTAVFGALLGPSAGLVDSGLAAARVLGDRTAGKDPPKRDVNQALAVVPFQSYYGMREIIQALNGNSPYMEN